MMTTLDASSTEYIITLVLYMMVVFTLCYYANKRNKKLSDYVLGHRSLSAPIAALGAGASDMSGWLLLALPGAVFVHGLSEIWMPIGLIIGAYVNWRLVSPRLRTYTEIANDALTIPAYFDHRFQHDSKHLRVISALMVLIFFTFYSAAGFVSGALLFETAFNVSYQHALWYGALIIMVYTAFGGFLAISWIDFFQGILMFFALIITPLYTLQHLGGWQNVLNQLAPLGPHYLSPLHSISTLQILSLLAWGLGYFGQPHILVRFMAVRSVGELGIARRICMSWMTLSLLGAIATGIIGRAYFTDGLSHPENNFLLLAENLFIPWLAGIIIAAVLSAIMSTSSAQLLASSSALTEDFYHRFLRKNASQAELVLVSRLTVGLIALIAILLAQNPQGNILNLVSYAWAGLGAAFGPAILFSLFWPRVTGHGAIAGILSGGIIVIVWKALLAPYGGFWTIYEIIPGFIISSMAIVIVSLLSPHPSSKTLSEFNEAKRLAQG